MKQRIGIPLAQDVLNNLDTKTLSDIFKFFGDEREAYNIARNIVKLRKNNFNIIPILKQGFLLS